MLDYEEHEHASYNANQIKLLRGRKLSELSLYEQLQFANLMSIARAAAGRDGATAVSVYHRFKKA